MPEQMRVHFDSGIPAQRPANTIIERVFGAGSTRGASEKVRAVGSRQLRAVHSDVVPRERSDLRVELVLKRPTCLGPLARDHQDTHTRAREGEVGKLEGSQRGDAQAAMDQQRYRDSPFHAL